MTRPRCHPVLSRVVAVLSGNLSKTAVLRHLLPVAFGIMFGCFLVAMLLFPPDPVTGGPGYVPFLRTISGQGNLADNPAGAWVFTLGLVVASCLLVPFNVFAWRRFTAACKGIATFTLVLLVLASVGFAMVGIWDEQATCLLRGDGGSCVVTSERVHDIGAALAFGGNLLGVLLHLFPSIAAVKQLGHDHFRWKWQLGHVIGFVATFIIAEVLQGIPATGTSFDVVRRSSFWQWAIFLELVVYHVSLAIRLPGTVPRPPVPVVDR